MLIAGLIWNVYFGILSLAFGFWLAVALALGRNARSALLRVPASSFICPCSPRSSSSSSPICCSFAAEAGRGD